MKNTCRQVISSSRFKRPANRSVRWAKIPLASSFFTAAKPASQPFCLTLARSLACQQHPPNDSLFNK